MANKNHIKNIRAWLELISLDPILCKDLLAALIINLTQGGIFIFTLRFPVENGSRATSSS